MLAEMYGSPVLLTSSGTHALEMAIMAAGIGPGDEVVVPSYAFTSLGTAVQRSGAKVVFADVSPTSLCLTRLELEHVATPNTRAVIALHYAGRAEELNELARYCRQQGILLIEDAAHATEARYEGRLLGTIGDVGCLSFHATKNISCGEGGAVVVNTPSLLTRLEHIREKGTNRKDWSRGQVAKYQWVSPGSSFLMSDISAALLVSALEEVPEVQRHRERVTSRYLDELKHFGRMSDFSLLPKLEGNEESNHIFALMAPDRPSRDSLVTFARSRGVELTTHYEALSKSPWARANSGPHSNACPISESVSARIVRLPIYPELSDQQIGEVVEVIFGWLSESRGTLN